MAKQLFSLIGAAALALGTVLIAAPPASAASAVTSTGWLATLKPVTANKVTGSGTGWITLTGDSAAFTVQISGLIDAAHPADIYIGAQGSCPGAAQAHDTNGQTSITASAGAPLYGTVGASLTTSGDTSAKSALALSRFPSASSYTYERTFALSPAVVANLEKGTAVLVVSGIDENGNGRYDSSLGASDLSAALPAEATDPALCGAFVAAQMPLVPTGPAATGGGSAAGSNHPAEMALGGAALVAALLTGMVGLRRRRELLDVGVALDQHRMNRSRG